MDLSSGLRSQTKGPEQQDSLPTHEKKSILGLPQAWNAEHDLFVARLDALGYNVSAILHKIREFFPELRGEAIWKSALDRRIQILDRRTNDYFSAVQKDFPWRGQVEAVSCFEPEPDSDSKDESETELVPKTGRERAREARLKPAVGAGAKFS